MREKVATKAINLSLYFNIPKANLTPNQLLNNKVEQNSISIAAPEPFQSSFLCSNHSLTLVGSRNKREFPKGEILLSLSLYFPP